MKKAVLGLYIPAPPISVFIQSSGQHLIVNTHSEETLTAFDEPLDYLRIRA